MTSWMNGVVMRRAGAALVLAGLAGVALADGHDDVHHKGPAPARIAPAAMRFDDRYHHDRYYPAQGQVFVGLPTGSVSVGFGGGHYFFHGGVWFRPQGPRYVVVTPPVGIVVPALPAAFATVWVGGVAYYYANGTYYSPVPGQGYVVVTPPPGVDSAQAVQSLPAPVPEATTPAPAAVEPLPPPIIYPRKGQSAAQTEQDRQECDQWALAQPNATSDESIYQRAMLACMDARGYTLR